MSTKAVALWQDQQELAVIRENYGKNLTAPEWNIYLRIGQATGLNPFLREIWAVKYGNEAAQIFIGRDGYRKSAQAHKRYGSHTVDAVYSNDTFEVNPTEGKVHHVYNIKDRGQLIGAYCLVVRKSSNVPMFNFVELNEYNTGRSVWKTKPATMIKKVAEAQGLRGAFQELFAGTYEESEAWNDRQVVDVAEPAQKKEQEQVPEGSIVFEPITPEQIKKYNTVWGGYYSLFGKDKEKNPLMLDSTSLRRDMIKKATGHDSLKDISKNAASKMIDTMEKRVIEARSKEQSQEVDIAEVAIEVFDAPIDSSSCCFGSVITNTNGKKYCCLCGCQCSVRKMTVAEREQERKIASNS